MDFEIERYELINQSASGATVQRTREDGLQITKTYAWVWRWSAKSLRIDVEFKNVGPSKWSGPVWVGAVDVFTGSAGRYSSVARPAIVADESLTSLDDIEDVESSTESVDGSVSWFGIQDTYFMAAAIPQDTQLGTGLFASVENGDPEKSAAGSFLVKDNLTLSAQESDHSDCRSMGSKISRCSANTATA